MASLDFYFDCSSPWTYLGFTGIHDIATRNSATINWKPVLVGGIFNAVNQSVYEQRANPVPVKARYYQKDLADWAHYYGIAVGMPPVFPVNAVKSMRGAFVALDEGCLVPYATAVFEAYWGDLKDISRDDVLRDLCVGVGLDPDHYFAQIADDAIKARLRANTDEVIARGGFGSPTIFLDDAMFFGNDRLPLIDRALQDLRSESK
jgi:2-hydroxychromene-2-carboxylate isomerase